MRKKINKKKYKKMPDYVDKTPSKKFLWNFYDAKEQVRTLDDSFTYIIIPKLLYEDLAFTTSVQQLLNIHRQFFFVSSTSEERIGYYAYVFENANNEVVYKEFLKILESYLIKKELTLKDFIEGNLYDYKSTYKRIIIYNSDDEIISNVICSKINEEVYDTRNNHGVKVAKTEDNFLYNFLTKTIKSLPISALDERILFYVTSKQELKIKLLTGNYKCSKKYAKVQGQEHLYKKKKPNK